MYLHPPSNYDRVGDDIFTTAVTFLIIASPYICTTVLCSLCAPANISSYAGVQGVPMLRMALKDTVQFTTRVRPGTVGPEPEQTLNCVGYEIASCKVS